MEEPLGRKETGRALAAALAMAGNRFSWDLGNIEGRVWYQENIGILSLYGHADNLTNF